MFTVNSYLLAVIFCIVTMICWGSWGNTQKLVSKNWRYELFYWDYVIGMVLFIPGRSGTSIRRQHWLGYLGGRNI